MSKFSKANPYFSFMIVPPGEHSSISFRISAKKLSVIFFLLGLLIIGVVIAVFFASHTSYQLSDYSKVKKQTSYQYQMIDKFQHDIDNLKNEMKQLIEKEEEIRNIFNRKKSIKVRRSTYRGRASLKRVKIFEKKYQAATATITNPIDSLSPKFNILKTELAYLKKSLFNFSSKAQKYRSRFAATPSIWPVYGRIISDFGWRTHPIMRKREFHKGLDIPSWIGAPIKATADGVVFFAGWGSGYGLTTAIDHGYGLVSLYAHASKLLCRQGSIVKKGQTIANVGSSGLSTGPHVHYELRKWRKAVSPRPYLDLDLFTAYTNVW